MIGSDELFALGARGLTLTAESAFVREEEHQTSLILSTSDDDLRFADVTERFASTNAGHKRVRVEF
ncbi:MAG: hypothetical protein U9R51_07020 [Actinomycetota bacterium]|nr:hypothetical protein [Actinomycetota bacterium]